MTRRIEDWLIGGGARYRRAMSDLEERLQLDARSEMTDPPPDLHERIVRGVDAERAREAHETHARPRRVTAVSRPALATLASVVVLVGTVTWVVLRPVTPTEPAPHGLDATIAAVRDLDLDPIVARSEDTIRDLFENEVRSLERDTDEVTRVVKAALPKRVRETLP